MTRRQRSASGPVQAIGPSVADFEAGQVDPGRFDHRAHVYVGWCYLDRLSLVEAIHRFTRALRRFTRHIGQQDKYHETISWFFMIQIANRRRGDAAVSWQSFCDDNPDLLDRGGELLRRYYSDTLLRSQHARDQFVLPDRGGR